VVYLFCGELLPFAGRRVARTSGLGDESGLGEEATFLFLGLAVDGDLDGHLGCVLKRCQQDAMNDSLSVPTYLVNVWLGTRSASNNVLDELGHLAHDIDTVSPGAEAA